MYVLLPLICLERCRISLSGARRRKVKEKARQDNRLEGASGGRGDQDEEQSIRVCKEEMIGKRRPAKAAIKD